MRKNPLVGVSLRCFQVDLKGGGGVMMVASRFLIEGVGWAPNTPPPGGDVGVGNRHQADVFMAPLERDVSGGEPPPHSPTPHLVQPRLMGGSLVAKAVGFLR